MRRVSFPPASYPLSAALFVLAGRQLRHAGLWPSSLSSGPSAASCRTANRPILRPELAALGAEPPGRGDVRLHSLVLEWGAPIHWSSSNRALAPASWRGQPGICSRVEDNPVRDWGPDCPADTRGAQSGGPGQQRGGAGAGRADFHLTAPVLNQADTFLVLSSHRGRYPGGRRQRGGRPGLPAPLTT